MIYIVREKDFNCIAEAVYEIEKNKRTKQENRPNPWGKSHLPVSISVLKSSYEYTILCP